MDNASQQQAPPPCACQHQFRDALPWLAVGLAILVVLDRFVGRAKKRNHEGDGAAPGGANDGGKR
jgi:hypothetical protein